MITIKKVTRLRVKISKSRTKSIFMVFLFGLRQTHLSVSYFFFNIVHYHKCVISICFESYMITIKKVTRLRVRISKSTIKSIFMVFPSGLRQTHLFWKLFYFNVVHYNQWCHLNMFWELYDYYQKSNKT